MQHSPGCIVFWTYALALCAPSNSYEGAGAGAHAYFCLDEMLNDCDGSLKVQQYLSQSSGKMSEEKGCINYDDDYLDLIQNRPCLIYPGNVLNCSLPSLGVSEVNQTSVSVIVCGDGEQNSSIACLEASGVAEARIECQGRVEGHVSSVIFHVNVSHPQAWTLYTFKYEYREIEVLAPPPNISLSVSGGDLLVTWNVPFSRSTSVHSCFDYELNVNNQIRTMTGRLNYTEPNRDPTLGYNVIMRTKKSTGCLGTQHWSDWSDIVGLEPSSVPSELNYLVIIQISLGIPMVLMALLLLIRPQRVIKFIFPPIPHPPLKIKHLLEKDAASEFPCTVQTATCMEDITNVDHIEEAPETATVS